MSSADFFKQTFSKIISLPETFLFCFKKQKHCLKSFIGGGGGGGGYALYVYLPIIRTLDTSKLNHLVPRTSSLRDVMSHNIGVQTMWYMRPTKTQTSLRVRAD